jgi:hypothetical protein
MEKSKEVRKIEDKGYYTQFLFFGEGWSIKESYYIEKKIIR